MTLNPVKMLKNREKSGTDSNLQISEKQGVRGPSSLSNRKTRLQELEKIELIAEVMQLLEEAHKGKDWIIEQIRLNHLNVSVKPTMSGIAILKLCPIKFITHVLNVIKYSKIDDFEGPPPLTSTYHWFFTDIVASSDPNISTNEQARKIIALNKLIDLTEVFTQRNADSTLILPTGDGMAIGFDDSPEKPLLLAIELHKEISRYNSQKAREKDRLYVRIGLDSGPVYIIEDLTGKENVWGPGIIMARRVMDLAREMNIIASGRIANDIRTLRPEYKSILHPIGDYSLKHGQKMLIYNVYGNDFGNKKAPTIDKVQKSKTQEEDIKSFMRFIYLQAELRIEIKDIKTMLAHHTIIWNLLNISNEPTERIFYYLDGDAPKNFPDMNVVVKDEDDKELDMISLNVNKPYHKEFYVQLRKPLKPNQKHRITKLEYDWEEPERQFFYRFASKCKKFNYYFSAPKELDVNHKVIYMDVGSGEKRYAKTPATANYLPDRTEITWEATNLEAHEAYRFDW